MICALAGCGGGSDDKTQSVALPSAQLRAKCVGEAKQRASDDAQDAKRGLIDCIAVPADVAKGAYPPTTPGTLAQLRSRLNGICADNAARLARARGFGTADPQLLTAAGAERLARLVRRMPTPTDQGGAYGGWRDALTTVARLSASSETAFRAQAVKTAAASRLTATQLGLTECAKP